MHPLANHAALAIPATIPTIAEAPDEDSSPVLTDAQIHAMRTDPDTFLSGADGTRLREHMLDLIGTLIAFAERHCAGAAVTDLQNLQERLGQPSYYGPYWVELLLTGRSHLTAIADALRNEDLPLTLRVDVITELARSLEGCGVGVDRELDRARLRLTLHGKGLDVACARMREWQREAWIEDICRRLAAEGSALHDLAPHLVRAVKQRLDGTAPLPDPALRRHEALLERLTARCRRQIEREVCPEAVALGLADECLAEVRDALHRRVGVAVDLAGEERHRIALDQILDRLSERYGRLCSADFMVLDADGMPELARNAGLIARGIRACMSDCKLAVPAEDRLVVTTGQGSERIALREFGGRLWYVEAGHAALRERHPVDSTHLRRLIEAPDAQWQLGSRAPLGLTVSDQALLVRAFLFDKQHKHLDRLPLEWLAHAEAMRSFTTALKPGDLASFLSALDVDVDDDAALGILGRLLTQGPQAAAQLRQLSFLRPELFDAVVPRLLEDQWQDDWNHPDTSRALGGLQRIAAIIEFLPLQQRQDALTLDARIQELRAEHVPALRCFLDLLVTCAERALVPSVDSLFNPAGPLGRALTLIYDDSRLLDTLLDTIERLHVKGALRSNSIVDFLTFTDPQRGTREPLLLRLIRHARPRDLQQYLAWLLRNEAGLPVARVEELLYPPWLVPARTQQLLQLSRDPDAPLANTYLLAIRQALRQGLLTDAPDWLQAAARSLPD